MPVALPRMVTTLGPKSHRDVRNSDCLGAREQRVSTATSGMPEPTLNTGPPGRDGRSEKQYHPPDQQ